MNAGQALSLAAPLGAKIATAVVVAGFFGLLIGQVLVLRRRNSEISVGPVFAFAAFCLIGLYGLGQLVDAIAVGLSDVPRPVHDSLVERLVLGRIFHLGPLLPLRAQPLVAAPIHVAAALGLYLALIPLCWWLGGCRTLGGEERRYYYGGASQERFWQRIYGLCGYGTIVSPPAAKTVRSWSRTLEPRFAAWLWPLCSIGALLLLGAFFEMFQRDALEPPHLPPFLWASCLVLLAAAVVVLVTGLPDRAAEKEQDEEPAPPPPADSLAWIAALRARGFAVSATPALVLPPPTTSPASEVKVRWTMPSRGPLPELAGLITREGDDPAADAAAADQHGAQLWSHQTEALGRLLDSDEDVLLCTAPRSGKTAVAELLCAELAVARGQNALLIFRDEPTARAAKTRFAERLAGTDWRENLRCTLAGAEMLRLLSQKRSPVLAFAHPDPLDRLLASHHDYRYFLEHLGLVVVEDIERHSGIRGSNLAYIMRRCAAILELLRARPRYLATLGVAARDFERYAETLLGVDLQLVASDGTPGVGVALHPAQPPAAGELPPAAIAAAEATAHQLPLTLAGFAGVTRTELDRAAAVVTRTRGRVETVAPERAQVAVVELSGVQLPRLDGLTRHGGWRALAAGDEQRQLLLPAPDALSRWLAADLKRVVELGRAGRRLIAEPRCPEVARRHLERCLAEQGPRRPFAGPHRPQALVDRTYEAPALAGPAPQGPEQRWASQVFGEATLDALEAEGRLGRQTNLELSRGPTEGPPELTRVTRLRLAGPMVRATLGASRRARVAVDTVRAEPVTVTDQATGQVLRRLDPGRAPLVAYPGAALLHRGRRFVIPLSERPAYEHGARVGAELCEQELLTVRVRRLSLALPPASDEASAPPGLNPLSLGGITVAGGLLAVDVTEEIVGVRRYRRAALGSGGGHGWRATVSSFPAIEARFAGEAWILTLGEGASEPAVHALVHLLRALLPARLDCGEEGLHIGHAADLHGQGPALLLIDTHEGGVGYARAIDLSLLESVLRLAQRILGEDCCEDAARGCPRCVRSLHCHEVEPEQAELDRPGAKALINRLLGSDFSLALDDA